MVETKKEKFPFIPPELMEDLDKRFPHRCPRPGEDEQKMWMYAGKRELIDWLLSKFKQSNLPDGDVHVLDT